MAEGQKTFKECLKKKVFYGFQKVQNKAGFRFKVCKIIGVDP